MSTAKWQNTAGSKKSLVTGNKIIEIKFSRCWFLYLMFISLYQPVTKNLKKQISLIWFLFSSSQFEKRTGRSLFFFKLHQQEKSKQPILGFYSPALPTKETKKTRKILSSFNKLEITILNLSFNILIWIMNMINEE